MNINFTPTGDIQPSCTYSLSPTSVYFKGQGDEGTITISTQAGCAWNVQYRPSWFEPMGASSGTGSGVLSYRVLENPSFAVSRGDSVTIGGVVFRVDQDNQIAGSSPPGSCAISLAPAAKNFTGNGGYADVSLTTSPADCSWKAIIPEPWIAVSPSSGQGSRTVRVSVTQNPSFAVSRGNVVTIGNALFRVDQDNQIAGSVPPATGSCVTAISPTSKYFTGLGGSVNVSVNAPSSCSWQAVSPEPWIHALPSSGTGSGTVTVTVDKNPSFAVSRGNALKVGDKALQIEQDNQIGP